MRKSAALGIGGNADDLRTGWYPNQPELAPARVSAPDFGQLFNVGLDGQVYAQPLLANGVLVVVTENNHVYSLDPSSGAVLNDRALEGPWNPADLGCGDLVPSVGITGTPVIDPTTNTAYFTTKTYVSGTSGPAAIFLHAVDVPTLVERPGFPVSIQGVADNQTNLPFDATHELQRPGLLMLGNTVYAAFGGHCDITPFKGWVVGVSTAGAITAMWAAEDQFNDGGGIWQSGGAPMSDGPDTMIVVTGNGEVPGVPTPGNQPPNLLGQAWVRLRVQGDGRLQATDFFMPYDAAQLNVWDADFGSGGPMGLPDAFGTPAYPHLAVAAGKQGYVYLLNRDDLGGLSQGVGGGDRVVQRLGTFGGVWSRPAAWPGSGGWVYYPTASGGGSSSGSSGMLNVFSSGQDGSGVPTLALAGSASDPFGFGSSAPVVTSDGVVAGSAMVWIVWSPDGTGAGGQLRGYDAVPDMGTLPLRFQAPIGTASKFNPPGVGEGRIYVGTRDGHVVGFGSPVVQPLAVSGVDFGVVNLGNTAAGTATFTARERVLITSVASTGGEFVVGATMPPLPTVLGVGDTLSVPLTFQPTLTGIRAAALIAQTNAGQVSTFLTGRGRTPNPVLSFAPPAVSFGGTPLGQTLNGTVTFSNVGGAPLTVESIVAPAAPFSASGLPAVGATLGPDESVTVTLAYAPTTVGSFTGSLVLATSAGTATVPMSGSATLPGDLAVEPTALDFGSVNLGQSATRSFEAKNVGGSRVTVTKSKPPAAGAGFTAAANLPEGSTLNPGDSLTMQVTFAPTTAGPASDHWVVNADGTHGVVTLALTGIGAGSGPPPDGGTNPDGGSGNVLPTGGCSAAAGTTLWPVLAVLPWMLFRRRRPVKVPNTFA